MSTPAEPPTGATILNIVAVPPTATGPPPTDLVAPRAATPLQTVKRPHSRGKPTARPMPGRGKPTGKPLAEASGLAPHVTPRPTGLPAEVEPLQLANEPQLPVTPPLAGLRAAETRVPSGGAPVDTTDPALAPPAAAVPPAWVLAGAEASAAEAGVVGADERASYELLAPRLLASGS